MSKGTTAWTILVCLLLISGTIRADQAATYTRNPKPEYPDAAKRQGHQGKVILKVSVNDLGLVTEAEIEESSGYEELDESALKTVSKWHFIAAVENGINIDSEVTVPIIFTLRD